MALTPKPIDPKLIDELLQDCQSQDDLLGQNGMLQQLTKALVERALQGELTHHLGYDKHAPQGKNSGNSRNGTSAKTIQGKRGQLQIEVPRDRNGEFEPQLIKKNQTRFDGMDEKIISLYARGMTTREIQGHLLEIYGVEVSPTLVSTVTDAVLEEVREWQSRPLDSVYPILYLDALRVKVKSQGRVVNKAIYLAFGVNLSGRKEVLGLWASENESAKFWMQVMTELKNRGVQDIYIACVDGLSGFPEAIEAVYPKTQVQVCLVHLVRYSLNYVSHRDRKEVATDLKLIYQATTLEAAERELSYFEEKWRTTYPMIARSWRFNWGKVAPMFSYPPDVRRVIYTTNAIESLNMTLRKISKNRALFPSDEAVFKLLYLGLRNISQRWTMPLSLSRASLYYQPRPPCPERVALMHRIDEIYTAWPFYGSRKITQQLQQEGKSVCRETVRAYMRQMGLAAISPQPNLSRPALAQQVYPYLLRGLSIERVNQVWGVDITYIWLTTGFAYLVAFLDWYSRYVVSWELSETLEMPFVLLCTEAALGRAVPEIIKYKIINSDQGSHFTSERSTHCFLAAGARVSMDGRGRYMDNIFTERLWRTVKYHVTLSFTISSVCIKHWAIERLGKFI